MQEKPTKESVKEQPERGPSVTAEERRKHPKEWSSPWNTAERSSELRAEACLDSPAWRFYRKGSSSEKQTGVAKERKIHAKSLFEDGKHKFKVKVAHPVMQYFSSNVWFLDESMEKMVGGVNLAEISPHNNKRCRERGARVLKEGKLWYLSWLRREGEMGAGKGKGLEESQR